MSSSVLSVRPALPPPLRAPLGVTAVLAAVVVVVLAVCYSGQNTGSAFDQWALSAVEGTVPDPSPAFTLSWIIGTSGDPAVAAVLVAALAAVCLALGRRRLAVLAVAGPAATGIVTTVLKPVVGRTINGDHLSYPSGHTALLTAVGIIVALLVVDRLQPGRPVGMLLVSTAAVLAGAAMSWSQTASDVHYATDTLGGFCAALALVPAAGWLIDRVADRRVK